MFTNKGRNVWVVRSGRGFTVKEERKPRPITPVATQRASIAIGRILAIGNRSELIVQRRNGRIRIKDSHGKDPFPPKG